MSGYGPVSAHMNWVYPQTSTGTERSDEVQESS